MMGLFRSLADRLHKRGVRRAFQSYVTPEVVEKVLRDPDSLHLNTPVHRPVDFVLIMLKDHDLEALPDRLRRIADAVHETGGWLERLTGPLVVATFGILLSQPPDPAENARRRNELVARLRNELAAEIKILHG